VTITRADDAWLVDFGRCIDGWPKLSIHANRPGDVIRVRYFQMTVEQKSAGWDEYICQGGSETWDANFGRHTSFQMLKITGYSGTLKPSDVRGVLAYCDVDVAGHFRCSNPLLNDIYTMCVRSAQQNIQQGVISVDADREQSPWLGDAYLIGKVLLYNDRDTTMIDKVARDFAGEQFPDGYIPAVSPGHRLADSDPSRRIPEWAMYWPMSLWEQYLFSGDETLLREMAPRLVRFLVWIKAFQNTATKLLDPQTQWRISDYAGGNMPSGGYNIATASQYYQVLRVASWIFSVVGQIDQSNEYKEQAQQVKVGINANLFNGEYYLARTDRKEMFPLASAWAFRYDIDPPAERNRILAAIEKEGKPDIGGYGGDALYSGLLNAGGGAFVVQDLDRYRPMLNENKACWESFQFGPNFEVNHAWTSYPGYQFLMYIVGIQPTSGGFATFDIRPETNGLSFAEGVVPTVKDPVTVRWERDTGSRFTLSVTVPPNTHATIYIPKLAKGQCKVMESGRQLWPAVPEVKIPGILAVREEVSAIQCVAGSGSYRFIEIL